MFGISVACTDKGGTVFVTGSDGESVYLHSAKSILFDLLGTGMLNTITVVKVTSEES